MSQVKFDFSGENYVVTGASSGMGKQIALELANSGANVLAIARRSIALSELQSLYPQNITIGIVDVCDEDKLNDVIASFVAKMGKIHGAVHAAGISRLTPLRAFDEQEARKIMETSFWSGVKLLQICTKAKNVNKGASFVFFSSVRATRSDKGSFAYSASKAAIKIAVHSFAKELASKGIRVNSIAPGWVNTELTAEQAELHNLEEVNRSHLLGIGEPDVVSGSVLFLLSDSSRWITGTELIIDGGYLA